MVDPARRRRATVRDVAEKAGVSISTVSLAFHYPGRVAATTRQRIIAVSAELGYAPRTQAASQPNGRFFILLMEELSLFAFPETVYGTILRTIEEKARQQQVGMLLATVEKGQVPHSVRERQAQGAIVLGGCPENDALALELAALNLPLVLVDTYIPGAPITSVLPDNEWGGYLAYQHLVEQGHRRIALIEGPSKYRTLVDRRWGALRAADELKVPIPPSYQQPSISSGFAQKGYREMKALLQLAEPPTAVFAVSDRAALGALEAIKEAGLRVPQDIALVGFDDQSNAEQASPSLTSVHYAREQIGALAFDLLLGQIEGSTHAPARHVVPSRLVVRASTCSARS